MKFIRKKGFTMVELIVVVGVIAVLLAMILPNLVTSESNKIRVTDAAKDYYVAVQHVMSKFAKYESDVAKPGLKTSDGGFIVNYNKDFGGNRPVYEYAFISMHVVNTRIVEASGYSADSPAVAMAQVLQGNNTIERALVEDKTYDTMDPDLVPAGYRFLAMFMDEMNAVFEAEDGFYYALIRYDNTLQKNSMGNIDGSPGSNVLKVVMTGYGDYALPTYADTVTPTIATGFDAYKTANLLVTELGVISTGDYFGIQSSELQGSDYIGESGTYFAIS